jgi:hypothetical protein
MVLGGFGSSLELAQPTKARVRHESSTVVRIDIGNLLEWSELKKDPVSVGRGLMAKSCIERQARVKRMICLAQ